MPRPGPTSSLPEECKWGGVGAAGTGSSSEKGKKTALRRWEIFLFFFCIFEPRFYHVAQAGLVLSTWPILVSNLKMLSLKAWDRWLRCHLTKAIFLPQSPKDWKNKHAPQKPSKRRENKHGKLSRNERVGEQMSYSHLPCLSPFKSILHKPEAPKQSKQAYTPGRLFP